MADQGEGAGEPAERLVRGEELLHLGDGGAAAETGERADELDVGEVAGGERVRLAAPEEAEALKRPRTDPRDPDQAAIAIRVARIDATARDLAAAADQRKRPRRREVEEFFAPYTPYRALAGAFALIGHPAALTAGRHLPRAA